MAINSTRPGTSISGAVANRRGLHRALMEISGCVSDGTRSQDCVVLDLSLGGAMLKIDSAAYEITKSFATGESLTVTLESDAPVLLSAAVVWRRGSVLGMRFLQAPEEVAGSLEQLLPGKCFKGLGNRDFSGLLP